jgi:hypothetical protein
VFEAILDKFFQGAPDRKTLELLHLTPWTRKRGYGSPATRKSGER